MTAFHIAEISEAEVEKVLAVDNIIAAIGQVPDLSAISDTAEGDENSMEAKLELTRWGTIVADESTGATAVPGVYAGGDVVTGAATAMAELHLVVTSVASTEQNAELGAVVSSGNIRKTGRTAFPAGARGDRDVTEVVAIRIVAAMA